MEEFNFMDGKLYYRKSAAEQWQSINNAQGPIIANRLNDYVKIKTHPNKTAIKIINNAMKELNRETGSYELKQKYMLLVGASMELGSMKGYRKLADRVNEKGKELFTEVGDLKTSLNFVLVRKIQALIREKFLEMYKDDE
jgi:hypothetical protein